MSPPSQAVPVIAEDADTPTGRCLARCAVKRKAPRRLYLSLEGETLAPLTIVKETFFGPREPFVPLARIFVSPDDPG